MANIYKRIFWNPAQIEIHLECVTALLIRRLMYYYRDLGGLVLIKWNVKELTIDIFFDELEKIGKKKHRIRWHVIISHEYHPISRLCLWESRLSSVLISQHGSVVNLLPLCHYHRHSDRHSPYIPTVGSRLWIEPSGIGGVM